MRILFALLLLHTAQAMAELAVPVAVPQPADWPHTVARTAHYSLLSHGCGWPGGAMRAQWVRADRSIQWGCWGYNDSGVQIQWSTGHQTWVPWQDLWTGSDQAVTYQTLHQRVLFLRNNK
jgi:hypothetical protein